MVSELRRSLVLPTRIGALSIGARVTGPSLVEADMSLRALAFAPRLPPGMSTATCTAVLLRIAPGREVRTIRLHPELETPAIASPCTGECLDAQEWSDGGNLVVIGTEDSLALEARYPGMGFAETLVVEFAPRAMTLDLDHRRIPDAASFHFIVAGNPDPEPVDASAWFAVDQPHEALLRLRQPPPARV